MKIVKIIAIVAAACGFMVSASCTCQQEAAPVHVEAAK
jgi:hypothetical protein